MKLVVGLWVVALVIGGCASTHRGSGADPSSDGEVDERRQDADGIDDEQGRRDGGDGLDGGEIDGRDGGADGGRFDAGDGGDSPLDAEVDAGEDDAEIPMCLLDLPSPTTWGTPDAPFVIPVGESERTGSVDWRSRAFVRFTGLIPGVRYVISADALSAVTLSVFDQDTTFTDAVCTADLDVGDVFATCIVTATGTTLDASIDAVYRSEEVRLTIERAIEGEGALDTPVPIAEAALPSWLAAPAGGTSFYEITGLTPLVPYVVSAEAQHDQVSLVVYEGTAFADGAPDIARGWTAHAIGTPSGTSLFVAVQAAIVGTSFELDVEPAALASQGTSAAPVTVASDALPLSGTVGWAYHSKPEPPPNNAVASSFYAITGLTPGVHRVLLGEVDEQTMLELFGDDASFTSAACWASASPYVPAQCAARITGSTLYVKVTNQGGGGTSLALELDLTGIAIESEGTPEHPVVHTLDALPFVGSVEAFGDSHYEITGLTPGQTYRATIPGTELATVIVQIDQNALNTRLCDVLPIGPVPQCTFTAPSSSVHLRVLESSAPIDRRIGAYFTFDLEPILEQSEGTPEEPIVFECAAGGFQSVLGTNGLSYYELTGLTPGTSYLIEILPSQGYFEFDVYAGDSAAPFDEPAACIGHGDERGYAARCVATAVTDHLFVRATGYYFGGELDISVSPTSSSAEGTALAPVPLALSDPSYAAEVSPSETSYYAFTGVTPGVAYVVRIAPVQEPVVGGLFAGTGFVADQSVGAVQALPGSPLETELVATDDTVYLSLALVAGINAASTVLIDLSEAAP